MIVFDVIDEVERRVVFDPNRSVYTQRFEEPRHACFLVAEYAPHLRYVHATHNDCVLVPWNEIPPCLQSAWRRTTFERIPPVVYVRKEPYALCRSPDDAIRSPTQKATIGSLQIDNLEECVEHVQQTALFGSIRQYVASVAVGNPK